MCQWIRKASGLGRARNGQTTAEYAIIVALVAVSSIAIIMIFGNQIRALFSGEAQRLATDQQVTVDNQTSGAQQAEQGSMTKF
jgi:Flp pilus assembly pilin Flp